MLDNSHYKPLSVAINAAPDTFIQSSNGSITFNNNLPSDSFMLQLSFLNIVLRRNLCA